VRQLVAVRFPSLPALCVRRPLRELLPTRPTHKLELFLPGEDVLPLLRVASSSRHQGVAAHLSADAALLRAVVGEEPHFLEKVG
jgi:hypothetical protein